MPAQRLAFFLQLLQQAEIDIAFAGFLGDEIPKVADLSLTDTVDTAKPLFEAIGVPRQVVIDHQIRSLEVDAFARGIGRYQDLDFFVVGKPS